MSNRLITIRTGYPQHRFNNGGLSRSYKPSPSPNGNLFWDGGVWGNLATRGLDVSKHTDAELNALTELYKNDSGNNWFGISKKNNPFSKGNIGNTAKGILSATSGAVSNFLSGGHSSGVGNALRTIGGVVKNIPVIGKFGALAEVAGGVVNGLIGGPSVNEEALRRNEQGTAAYRNFSSNASTFDQITGPVAQANVQNAYTDSLLGSGADELNAEQVRRRDEAKQSAYRSVANNVNNLTADQINNLLRNFAAYGGSLDTINPATAVGYSIYTDEYIKDKLKNDSDMTNLFAGTPNGMYGFGGGIYTKGASFDTGVSYVNTGGTHEENPNDGVQMGTDSQGVPNLVEQGEVRWNDYIFSDRLKVPRGKRGNYGMRARKYAEGGKLGKGESKDINISYEEKVLKPFEGLTFADAAKKIVKGNGGEERNDAITMRGIDAQLSVLAGILEKEREKEKLQEMQDAIDLMSPEEFAMLQQLMESLKVAEEQAAMQQQQMIPLGMENMQLQPVELQPIAALGGLLASSDNEFKYGGNLEKFTNELQSYGLTLDDYLTYYRTANNIADDKKVTLTDDNFNKDVAELYLKQVVKALKEVARKYKKAGLNPKDLTGASLEAYQRDVTAAARGTNVSDGDLAINGFSSNNRGDARITDFNKYAYTRTTKQNLIGEGATALSPNKEGKFDINYGIENPTGLTYVEGMPKWNASSQQWEDSEGKKIDNPFGEGTKFSDIRGGGYNSQFENLDALSQYYKELIAKRFQAIKGDKYQDSRLPHYYLSKDELNNWITDLEGSSDAKDKELATMLRANWNLGADDLVESDTYLGLDAVKANRLQSDKKPGIEHIPYLDAIPYSGVRYREVGLDGNPTDNYVNWDPANPTAGFSVIEQPLSTEGGVTTYGIRRNNLATNVGVLPDGTYVAMTPEQAAAYQNNKIADPSQLTLFEDPLTGYEHTSTYYDLSKDAQGNPLGLKEVTERDPFPEAPSWPYLAGLGIQAGALGYNILSPADYSNANAMIKAAQSAGNYRPIEFRPIGNYLTYRPMDIWYELNRLNANARATDRAIMNSGVNQGTKNAALLASNYNDQISSGNLYRLALEYNDALRKQVGEFNKDTDKFNSEGFLKADMANQDAATRAVGYQLEGLKSGYAMRQAIDDAKANAISAGISGIGTMLYNMADTNYKNKILGWSIRQGALAPQYTRVSKGGKVKRKRGLSF